MNGANQRAAWQEAPHPTDRDQSGTGAEEDQIKDPPISGGDTNIHSHTQWLMLGLLEEKYVTVKNGDAAVAGREALSCEPRTMNVNVELVCIYSSV